jgi:hypothetical protein
MHGGQRLVIFRGDRYVGQYHLSPPPYVTVTLNGSRVVLRTPGTSRNVEVDLSSAPPKKILVNGEVETLYR